MPQHPTAPTAYSYVRFSHPSQAEGDSLRRQTEMAEAYCARRGWVLDQTLTLRDLGVSAFRGKNALVGRLGAFLAAVKRGTVTPGSVLIVESVDRISRQGIDEGYELVKGLLKAGIIIVTLSPEREFDAGAVKSLSKGALELQLILERAAEESERKSDRLGRAWKEKRSRAREGVLLTRRLPRWVALSAEGKPVLVPERAVVVRRIFELAGSGYGYTSILRKLHEDGVAPFAPAERWSHPYLCDILTDGRALGLYQPRGPGRVPEGPPVPGYFPAVVTEDEFLRAQAHRLRAPKRTGTGRHVNLWTGLLKEARSGEAYLAVSARRRMFVCQAVREGRGPSRSFPVHVFEREVLPWLGGLDPHAILNGDDAPDDAAPLGAELAGVEAELQEATAFMNAEGFSPAIGARVKVLEARQAELAADLALARQEARHPTSESWGAMKALVSVLYGKATDPADRTDIRIRLRAQVREVVESVTLLVVPRGMARWGAVQVHFRGTGKSRSYLIRYRPACRHRKECWDGRSFTDEAGDLRRAGDVRRLERLLAGTPD